MSEQEAFWENFTPSERRKLVVHHFWVNSWPVKSLSALPVLAAIYFTVGEIAGKNTNFQVGVSVSVVANIALAGTSYYYYRQWQAEKRLRLQAERKPVGRRNKKGTTTRRGRQP